MAMLRGRPDCAMAMRLSRLRAATMLLQLPIQEVYKSGSPPENQSLAMVSCGEGRKKGGTCPRVVYHQRSKRRVGVSHLPLVAGSSVHKPPAALPIDGNAGTASSQAQHRGQSQSPNAEEVFPRRHTLIDRVRATLHRRRPVSVAESSRRWPSRGQKENLLCVPPPSPRCIFHRTRNFVWKKWCRFRFGGCSRKEQRGGNGGKTPKRASRRGHQISSLRGAVQVQNQVVAVRGCIVMHPIVHSFFVMKIIFLCMSRLPGLPFSEANTKPLSPPICISICQSDM